MIYIKKFATQAEYDAFLESPDYIEPHVSTIEGVGVNYNLPPKIYTFAGFQIAPGPLYYSNETFVMSDHWNHDTYNSIYALSEGSYCLPASYGYEHTYPMGDDWMIPSIYQWRSIVGTDRAGATVNNQQNKHYAILQLTGVQHAGITTPIGLLLFPDNETITGCTLTYMDQVGEGIANIGITESQLNEYLEQGCTFLPGSGSWGYGSWSGGGTKGSYASATDCGSSGYYVLSFDYADYGNTTSHLSTYGVTIGQVTIRCIKTINYIS